MPDGPDRSQQPASGRVGVADELARGRAASQRLDWAEAYRALAAAEQSAALAGDDIELLATAAFLLGHLEDSLQALQRAQQAHAAAGTPRRAARCLFWLGFTLLMNGDIAQAGGWLARAGRLLGHEQECAEQGLLLLPLVVRAIAEGDHADAVSVAARAAEIGTRAGDAEVLSLALHFQGRALLRQGRVRDGLALLDESMVPVVAGELAPFVAGNIYCSMIDACQEISDLRRAHEWTVALTTWCHNQPDMVTFSGQCLIHRAEIAQLHGRWPEAVEEATRAGERLARAADRHATGAAHYRLAEIYRMRGEVPAAEQAYRRASDWGHEPQPGLALLRLAEGKADAARAAITRTLAETTDRLRRARLLPAQVEITLAVDDLEPARAAADELTGVARDLGTAALQAAAGDARGAVLLASGDAREALVALRRAWQVWQELDAPYEAARVRVRIGLGCRALGDPEAAAMELDSARRVFTQLGAGPDLARLAALAREESTSPTHGLTPRELQVLRLVATGKTNHAIAAELVLAEKTVDRHLSNIYAKLGVSSRTAAAAYAYQHRLG